MQTLEEIEQINKVKYEKDYSPIQTSINTKLDKSDYYSLLTEFKLELIYKHMHNERVLDIGCGTGDYLFRYHDIITNGIGVDFSEKMLKEAKRKKENGNFKSIEFVCCDVKNLPFSNGFFELCYSYATLYYVPRIELAISEISRVLKSGSGVAILEFGNLYSLNTIVCKAYPEWAIPCHISTHEMRRIIRKAGLDIITWRAFQILPLWGDRPGWLRYLLHPFWKKLLQRRTVKGKMLDELISSAPLFKRFAFRHIIVCRKK